MMLRCLLCHRYWTSIIVSMMKKQTTQDELHYKYHCEHDEKTKKLKTSFIIYGLLLVLFVSLRYLKHLSFSLCATNKL